MRKNKNIHIYLKLSGVLVSLGLALVFIYINVTAPVSVTAQTYPTPTGTSTTIVTSCQSFPNIAGNTACNLSNNVQQNVPNANTTCANGGIPNSNNVCPTSVIPLPSKPITQVPATPAPVTDQISINPLVNVIDDSNNINPISTNSIKVALNSLVGIKSLDFIATSNNLLIDKGQVKLQIQLQGRSGSTLTSSGILWVYVNGISLNPNGVQFIASGITDSNGNLLANLNTPFGTLQGYTFDIPTNISLINQGANYLSFNMSNISIQNEKGQKFSSVAQQQLFKIEIDNIANQIIQKNPQGQLVRVLPSDDTLTITSGGIQTSTYTVGSHGNQGTYYTSIPIPLKTGDVQVLKVFANGTTSLIGQASSIQGTDGYWSQYGGNVGSCSSGVCPLTPSSVISNIPRDTDIQIVVSGGASPIVKSYHTPVTQQSYKYFCTNLSCTFSP